MEYPCVQKRPIIQQLMNYSINVLKRFCLQAIMLLIASLFLLCLCAEVSSQINQVFLDIPRDFSGYYMMQYLYQGKCPLVGAPILRLNQSPSILKLSLVDSYQEGEAIIHVYEGNLTFYTAHCFNVEDDTICIGTNGWTKVRDPDGFTYYEGSYENSSLGYPVVYTITGEVVWEFIDYEGKWEIHSPSWSLPSSGLFDATVNPGSILCGSLYDEEIFGAIHVYDLWPMSVYKELIEINPGKGYVIQFIHDEINLEVDRECGEAQYGEDYGGGLFCHGLQQSGYFDLGKALPSLQDLKGKIEVQLKSSQPLALDENNIHWANISLYRQKGFVREKDPNETSDQYQLYLSSQKYSKVDSYELTPTDNSRFTFEKVPILESYTAGGTQTWRRSYYMVEIKGAKTDEVDLDEYEPGQPIDSNTPTVTVHFMDNEALNIKPATDDETYTEIFLTPFDGIGAKQDLVNALSKLSPNIYSAIEDTARAFIAQIKDGSREMTPESLEALKRAIWAERVVRDGGQYSYELLEFMLNGLANLLGDLIGELNSGPWDRLARKKEMKSALDAKLDAEILKSKGWFKGDTPTLDAQKIKKSMEDMIANDPDLEISEIASILKFVSNSISFAIQQGLVQAGMEESKVAAIKKGYDFVYNTMADIVITQGIGGLEGGIKLLINTIVKNSRDELFDSLAPYSYTVFTKDALIFANDQMYTWNVDDYAAYQNDRTETVLVLKDMGDRATSIIQIVTFTLAISDALGMAESALGVAGSITPIGRVTKIIAKIVKYGNNTASFVLPAVTVYYSMPSFVEEGVAKAYGRETIETSMKMRSKSTTFRAKTSNGVASNPNLLSGLEQSHDDLNTVLDQISTFLQADSIIEAVYISGSDAEGTFGESFSQFRRSVSFLASQAMSADSMDPNALDHLKTLIEQDVEFSYQAAELSQWIVDLYSQVLLLEYEGPKDPLYIAERNYLISAISSFKESGDELLETARSLSSAITSMTLLPAVIVDGIQIHSDVTGGFTITQTPENFSLKAHIKNISTASVSGLSAKLSVYSQQDSITVSTPLEKAVASGTLEADDGVDRSGTDEADVTWNFSYSGELKPTERIILQVEIMENGEDPNSFFSFSGTEVLDLDVSVADQDLDGIPDHYETENGLNPAVNDYSGDLDGDGIENGREYRIGTHPNNADTDNDGLSDGEEVSGGADGFVTDPLDEDTDDDGVNDSADGQPVDGGTTSAGAPMEEPQVSVNKTEVTLSEDHPFTMVHVTNSGQGELTWTAASDNRAIAESSPAAPHLRTGNGDMIIYAPVGYDFETQGPNETIIRVIDVGGATKDYQEITVTVMPKAIAVDMDLTSGWSLISLPVDTNATIKALFPDARAVFGFTTKYVLIDPNASLEKGRGYWINLSEAKTYTINGIPFTSYIIPDISNGWSMIGGCSNPAKAEISSGTIRAIFGFSNKYDLLDPNDTLATGKGYWINCSEQTTLTVEVE